MSTLFVNNLNTASGSTITIPTGKTLVGTDEGTIRTPGAVLQVKTATDSTERTSASSSFVTASNTLAVTLTPKSTSSKVFVTASLSYGSPSGTISFFPTIFRGSTNLGNSTNGFGNLFSGSSYQYAHATLQVLDAPSTDSAITYQVYFRIGSGSNHGRINNGGGGSFSTITAFEIAG
tara:strand:- start:1111 stop:1641 length:531 start_codon:yes stop_codon:yes gene_type:complete